MDLIFARNCRNSYTNYFWNWSFTSLHRYIVNWRKGW